MTHTEQILTAVRRLVGSDLAAEFSRDDIRREASVSQEDWSASYSPIFQGMREDQPRGAPYVGARSHNVFRRIRHGVHPLTEYGKQIVCGNA
jgi:hypothetical protein